MRILGIDYGDARIGLAVCDRLMILATPLKTLASAGMRKDIDNVFEVIKSEQIEKVVLGLPKNMDGSEGERAEKTRAFGKNLQKVSLIEVEYKDERLTSVSAEKLLNDGLVSKHKQKSVIDAVAAQIILQSYLDSIKNI